MRDRLALVALCVATASLTLGASRGSRAEHRLEIAGAQGAVWAYRIAPGQPFDVTFVHSQERTRWTQHYVAGDDGAIHQTGSTFGSYGAGMPTGPVRRTADGFESHVERRLVSIPMLSSKAAELTLIVEGRRMALDRWFPDFEAFEIRIR